MDNDKRSYRPVSVDMIGAENGTTRFTQDGITNKPPVARWRNNLTVMSQRHNLFFAATLDLIAVYQPEFPYQKLKRHPAILVQPELACPNALGYLSRRRHRVEEHCINHLVIGELGSQEILLLATDSGNIEAYYTASIQRAIDDVQRNGLTGRFGSSVGLQPFFKHWVYQSAWGLDIHKEARMIAVSSNVPSRHQPLYNGELTATITVFAFALADASSENEEDSDDEADSDLDTGEADDDINDNDQEDDFDAEWIQWNTRSNAQQPERTRNYKVVLSGPHGHVHNVPNICFVNSSEDPDGKWLLSTDITGIMKLWQIWKGTCLRQWDFSNEDNRVGAWLNASYPGWQVATLDVSTFRPVLTNTEFIGAERAPIHYGYHDRGPSFNITSIVRQIPGNSHFHPSHADFSDHDDDSDADQIINGDDIDEELQDGGISPTPENAPDPSPAPPIPSSQTQDLNDEDLGIRHADIPLEFAYVQEPNRSISPSSDDESDGATGQDQMEDIHAALFPRANQSISKIASKVKPWQLPNIPIPEIAMIHCSNSSIRMLGSPVARYPHIFCANIVRQALPEDIINNHEGAELQAMDRLNMVQKIPELGVLLIATQAGRVAVCSLTRKGDTLGFRVDWVLPTKKQEKSGQRPAMYTLIGMAVAPLQTRHDEMSESGPGNNEDISFEDGIVDGVKTTFDPKVVIFDHPTNRERRAQDAGVVAEPTVQSKPWSSAPREVPAWRALESSVRYRLMLTYADLSVLTYEISRHIEKRYERR